MFVSPISSEIISKLTTGSCNSAELVLEVAKICQCSIQSVYAVLRKLRKESVVILHKKILTLNIVWIEEQSHLIQQARATYIDSSEGNAFYFGTLEEGDRLTYQFKNPVLLDEMWGHLFLLLIKQVSVGTPIMIYNPHSWFPIVRYASERTIFESLFDNGNKAYFSFAGKEELDRDVCKQFVAPIGHSFSIGVDVGLKKGTYLNVIGDYIIEVDIDEAVAEEIDAYFTKYASIESANIQELNAIVARRGKNKLALIKSARRAHRWRSKLAKNFLIPKESRRFV